MTIQVSSEFSEEALTQILDKALEKNETHAHSNPNAQKDHNSEPPPFDVELAQHNLSEKKNQLKALEKEIGTADSRGGTPAGLTFICSLVIIVSFTFYSAWHQHMDYVLFRKVVYSISCTLIAGVVGLMPSIMLGCLVEKIYFPLWKMSGEARRLFALKCQKEEEIERLTADIPEQCKKMVTEQFYFETLLKFDHMVERIKKQYSPEFLSSEIFRHHFNDTELRKNLTHRYMNRDNVGFCIMAKDTLQKETLIAHLWQAFQRNDSVLLEQRYQEFAKNKTPEMINII